ncbi:hypothetical protein SGPA1_40716 [Streptomyces misionensis JCM 4497]
MQGAAAGPPSGLGEEVPVAPDGLGVTGVGPVGLEVVAHVLIVLEEVGLRAVGGVWRDASSEALAGLREITHQPRPHGRHHQGLPHPGEATVN